ncbi:MAG: PD-(D/E)XK nuclease family protein [Pseudobdellovibrionaceae bacterium]
MLKVALLRHPSEKSAYLEGFDANTATWVVSDLRNKFEIQQRILKQQNFYEDNSVLRASELWRILHKRQSPETKMISGEFISTWVKEQIRNLGQSGDSVQLGQQAHQVVLEMMDLMASVHTHSLGAQRIREWFRENPESLQRWGGWFLLSEEMFQKLTEAKTLAPKWAASDLQNKDNWKSFWDRPLIFDLGSQLSQVEADLIRALSRDLEVLVLLPEPSWAKEFEYLLKPSQFLRSQAHEKISLPISQSMLDGSEIALRFSGVLAETKKACEIVRAWLEEKIPPEEIAVIAPDIERYWPLLQPLFEAEGIPVAKDIFSRLQTLPSVAGWMSGLRLAAKDVKYSDLEMALFREEFPILRYEEFYSLFAELLSDQDLNRHEVVQRSFESRYAMNDEITRDEWLGFSVSCWKDPKDLEPLEICFKDIFMNTDPKLKMRVSAWIHLLEQIVAKKEIRLQKGSRRGIQLTNLSAGDSLQIRHRIFLGLTESMLRSPVSSLLSPKEILSISNELGFSLEHPEVSSWEFDLAWLSENPGMKNYYFYPQTGFSGGAEAPCALWLRKAGAESESLSQPQKIRWDSLLRAKAKCSSFEDAVENKTILLNKPLSLSPSSIETYRKCPFAFASQKLFRLQDLPIMDLDVDRRTRGQLAHALLEKLCQEPRRFDWTDEELRQIVEELKDELGLAKTDPFIWNGLKERHLQMALRFLKFEKEWFLLFPQTQTLAREKDFEFYWDLENQTVSRSGDWKIRGRIDRLDHDQQGRLVLIDYKLTAGDYKNHSKWIENNQLQLALYMLALEEGVIPELEAQDVVGAFYYVLKNMNRDRGLKVEEGAGSLFHLDKKKNRINEAKKMELLQTVKAVVQEVVFKIKSGDFNANPLEPEKCGECNWKNLCKAPHLN